MTEILLTWKLKLNLNKKNLLYFSNDFWRSKLQLVDLAGSERVKKTHLSWKCSHFLFCNASKFSDKQVWADSAYPDQAAPRGAV